MLEKYHQLIDFLYKENGDYVSGAILAEVLGVTDRTIRNYVKKINEGSSGIEIISSSQGYAIISEKGSVGQERLDANKKKIEDAFLEFEIIRYLMNKDDYVSYDEIADRFFFSPQTIRRRIQNLTMDIQELGINVAIDTKVFKGIKLIGTEIQKRILIERFFTSISIKKEVYQDFVINGFCSWVNIDIIEGVFKIVDRINIDFNLNLEFQMYKKITVQLIIIIHQIKRNKLVNIEANELTDLKSFKEYEVEKAFRNQLQTYVNIPNEESIYLVNYLMSLQLDLNSSTIKNKDPSIVKKIEDILLEVERNYHVPAYSKKRFKHNISDHIYRIIYPVSHNLLIYNPFVKETKSEYFFSFSIASNIALQIEKEFLVEIPESEIAYLAYHIQVILDSLDKRKIKTVILYSRNYERTKLLASKIATYFDELEIYKIEKYSPDYEFDNTYLYIGINITTTPQTNVGMIMVQNGFQSSDIKKIRFFLESQQSIVEQASIHWIEEQNPADAIRELLLVNNQIQFYDLIIKREGISYTSIGNLVAIPHPYFEKKEYKEQVIIGINKNSIKWGDEFVQLIIIYIPSSDIERNEYAFSEFYQKTKSLKDVRELIQSSTRREFIDIWNDI